MPNIKYEELVGQIDKLESLQVWNLFGRVKNGLIDTGLVRTGNIVAERGENFLLHRKWHSRMNAYSLPVTKAIIDNSTVIFSS